MNTEVQIYQFKANPVRTITDDSGNPWWVAKDVCMVLDLPQVSWAVKRISESNIRRTKICDEAGREFPMLIINEPGLYQLILRSDKPQAKEFQRWITHEVLPSIRKTGSYSAKPLTQLDIMQQSLDVLRSHEQRFVQNEQRLGQHDIEITTIKTEFQSIKETQTKLLCEPVRQLTDDRVLKAHISQWVREQEFPATKEMYRECYNNLYREFFYRYGVNLKLLRKNRGYKTTLYAAQQLGYTHDLLVLAVKMFPVKKESQLTLSI